MGHAKNKDEERFHNQPQRIVGNCNEINPSQIQS